MLFKFLLSTQSHYLYYVHKKNMYVEGELINLYVKFYAIQD